MLILTVAGSTKLMPSWENPAPGRSGSPLSNNELVITSSYGVLKQRTSLPLPLVCDSRTMPFQLPGHAGPSPTGET